MVSVTDWQFFHFLSAELQLPIASVAMALRHYPGDRALLPIVLWQYGLVTLDQVSAMFDWLEGNML